jgi:tRNA(Ile)-lysidine synthase TilS/MesJ
MIQKINCDIEEKNLKVRSKEDIERSIQTKFRTKLWSPFIRGLKEFEMIKDGDKIAVAVSGGKDSLLLAKLLQELQRTKSTDFEIHFISMNPGFNDTNLENLKKSLNNMGIPSEIYNDNIFEIAEKMSKESPCYLCAKMRRGSLYTKATSLGCNKLALGHHFDDVVETIMINMFYAGSYKTMMPKLKSQNYNIELIRPLYYVKEKDIKRFIRYNNLQPMNCGCTVASGKVAGKREEIKKILAELEKTNVDIKSKILNSSKNINLNQCIQWKQGENISNFMDEY